MKHNNSPNTGENQSVKSRGVEFKFKEGSTAGASGESAGIMSHVNHGNNKANSDMGQSAAGGAI